MTPYLAKDASVVTDQLKVQSVVLPLVIKGSSTAANIRLEGSNYAKLKTAAYAGFAGETIAATMTDSTGSSNAFLINIGETIKKVVNVKCYQIIAAVPTSQAVLLEGVATDGISVNGKGVVFSVNHTGDLATAASFAFLAEVFYIV